MKTFLMMATLLLAGWCAAAEDLGAVKARMKERVKKIAALKMEQAVGENNRGYLDVRAPAKLDAPARALVEAENADRRLVYQAIAEATHTTVELVGRRRAEQLREDAASGVLLQREDGSWYEKP